MKPLLNKRHEQFAQGVASGLSPVDAYRKVGYKGKGAAVSASRLVRTVKVRARIAEISEAIAKRAVETLVATPIEIEIASRNRRVQRLNDRVVKLDEVIRARSAAYTGKKGVAPGAETGLMVHRIRSVGHGPNVRMVGEWEIDTALLREMRGIEQQAAQELGQWTEKREITESHSKIEYGWVKPKKKEQRPDLVAEGAAKLDIASPAEKVQ